MKGVLESMLALVEEKRAGQQQRILAEARAEADALIAAAHRQARTRMRETIAGERRRLEQALHLARSQQETELRNHQMNLANRLLLQGQGMLERTLLERWRAPESRRAWIAAMARRAVAFLPRGQWEVRHPLGQDEAEWLPLEEIARQAGLPSPQLRGEATLTAGVRVGCQGAWVDGSVAGLLANRAAIDAALLALLQPEGASP